MLITELPSTPCLRCGTCCIPVSQPILVSLTNDYLMRKGRSFSSVIGVLVSVHFSCNLERVMSHATIALHYKLSFLVIRTRTSTMTPQIRVVCRISNGLMIFAKASISPLRFFFLCGQGQGEKSHKAFAGNTTRTARRQSTTCQKMRWRRTQTSIWHKNDSC